MSQDLDWVDGGTAAVWTRVISLWTAIGAAWATVDVARLASTMALLYTIILVGEWVWKRLLRPFLVSIDMVPQRHRRRSDPPPSSRFDNDT